MLPTVIEPLRSEWKEVQTAALAFEQQGKHKEAVAAIRAFHRHRCDVRVLDPACGSGNFLYVTLEHLKRLEGEGSTCCTTLANRRACWSSKASPSTPTRSSASRSTRAP